MLQQVIRKYWAELLTFGVIFGILLICCIPDITWINTDCDGPHYIYSAKYLYPAHKTSAPLFLLLGNVFLRMPIGMEAWRFALLSVFASVGTCVFIYLSIKWHTENKWYSLIGVLIFGSSALVISQSTIIETYALVTMFGTAGYYFSLKKKWVLTALALGAGGAIHHLIGIPIVAILVFNKEFRSWKYIGVMASFLLFYLYIPITNRPPYMWQSANMNIGTSFFVDNLSTMMMLWGGLSIWDLPKRIFDTIGILAVSLGLSFVIILWQFFITNTKKTLRQPLFWMFVLPVVYYATNLAPQTYVYIMPSIAIGAILAGIGLQKLNYKWVIAVACVSVIALGFNAYYFDVGRTLDKGLSARTFYNEELEKIPDGQILLAQQGWEWAIVFPYNMNNNRNIIPICTGTLASTQYQDTLREMGVAFETPEKELMLVALQNYIINSIIVSNENVWTTLPTNTRTYGAEIVRVDGHEEELDQTPLGITDGSMDMGWKWKPSNPYDIITGAIEVEEWIYIVFSNYSVATFVMMGVIGGVPVWVSWQVFAKKRKWSFRKVVKSEV